MLSKDFCDTCGALVPLLEHLHVGQAPKLHMMMHMGPRTMCDNKCVFLIVWELCINLVMVWVLVGETCLQSSHNVVLAYLQLLRIVTMGPPSSWSTWEDEGLNFNLKWVCNKAHRCVWHKRVLIDFNLLTARRSRKRRQ